MKKHITIIIILSLLVIALGGYIVYDKFLNDNNEIKESEKNNESTNNNSTNEDKPNKETLTTLLENEANGFKIQMDASGTIIVNADEFVDYIAETNVTNSFNVHADASNMCFGNEWLVFLKKDGTLSALSIDALACGERIRLETINTDLTDIKEVYDESTQHSEYEPAYYRVYIKDKSGNIEEITDQL